MVLRIAHRGASGYAPENSLEAFKRALELNASIVEFDVHSTRDDEIVVMHDKDIMRTTDGRGLIKEFSLKEIKKFTLSNGEPIPTSREVFHVLKGKCICKIHIKSKFIEDKIIEMVKENNMENSVIITSRILSVLRNIKKNHPRIKVEALFNKRFFANGVINKTKKAAADIVAPHYSITTRKLVEEAHKNGLEVHVWTVNNRRMIERLKRIGVDGISSDYPDRI